MNSETNLTENIVAMIVIFLTNKEIYAQEIVTITNDLISPFRIGGYVEAYDSTTFSDTFNNKKSHLYS